MKVIDLYNKIANREEVPKKIQVYSDIFVFDESNNVYEHEETRTNLLSIYNGNILNYKVAIIEEDKNIEPILIWKEGKDLMTKATKGQDIVIGELGKIIIPKINEIIDKINEERK